MDESRNIMKNFFNRKNFIYTMLISLVLIVFFMYQDFSNIFHTLVQASIPWLVLGLISMLIFWLLEAQVYYSILKKYTNHISLSQIFKLTLATQFFNGITPFATGGQPFQIYILHNESKMDLGTITSASVQNFIIYQLSLVLYTLLALVIHLIHPILLFGSNSTLVILLGFAINIIVIGGLFLISSSQKILNFISTAGLDFLVNIRLVKDKPKSLCKLLQFTQKFSKNMKQIQQDPLIFLQGLAINTLRLTFFYLVAYFVCRSLGLQISPLEAILASAYTMLITSVIPLPGASAGAEFGFLIFFSSFIAGPAATAIMLVWRFITYYVGLILGFIVFFFGYKPAEKINEMR